VINVIDDGMLGRAWPGMPYGKREMAPVKKSEERRFNKKKVNLHFLFL
jgi:hypothetical protein